MLNESIHSLSGPDFLDSVADAEAANGLTVNADIYRARARQWRDEQRALEDAENALAAATRRPRSASISGHAITPTDRRS